MWNSPGMGNTCIFLSTLLPSHKPHCEVNRLEINEQYRALAEEFADTKCIYLADMDPVPGPFNGWIRPDISQDGIHPNNEGHRKMAYIFWKTIVEAANDEAISPASTIIMSDL